jgi:hypothetical protein
MLDLYRALDELGASDPQISADVHGERRITGEPAGAKIGREAFAGASGVESRARRTGEGAPLRVEPKCSPGGVGAWPGRPARGRGRQRLVEWRPAHTGAGACIAGPLELPDERRVHESAGLLRGAKAGRNGNAEQWRNAVALRGRPVQSAELARGVEPRKPGVHRSQEGFELERDQLGLRGVRPERAADQKPDLRPEQAQGVLVLV